MTPMPDLRAAEALMRAAVPEPCPAAQFAVRWHGALLHRDSYGWIDPATQQRPTGPDTLFDLASVTKLFVVAAFMRLFEAGQVALDQPISNVLPQVSGVRPVQPYEDPLAPGEFVHVVAEAPPVDVGRITFRHLLTHTSGLPAWRPLFRQGSRAAARHMALTTFCSYPIGDHIVYSDIGLILLGLAIERLAGQTLDAAVTHLVTRPAGLEHTRYLPIETTDQQLSPLVAPTEICAWRGRRIAGEVHDENAAALGGVAGHAGLFSTAADVAAFGQVFLDGGRPLLRDETIAEMTRPQAEQGTTRRGLGFALWSRDLEASGNPFSQRAFGHTGFTGTSLWVDPERSLVVALLTNDVYYGRTGRRIGELRVALHRTIVQAVDRR